MTPQKDNSIYHITKKTQIGVKTWEMLKQILLEIQSMKAEMNEFKKEGIERFDKVDARFDCLDEKVDHVHLELRSEIKQISNEVSTQADVIGLLSQRSIEHEAKLKRNMKSQINPREQRNVF